MKRSLFVMCFLSLAAGALFPQAGFRTVSRVAGAYAGFADGRGRAARFSDPMGVVSLGGNLYVADTGNNAIRKVVISTGEVTTLAGRAGVKGSEDGTGAAARFNGPCGIATDGRYLYISDSYSATVRKVSISTGEVTTIAGKAGETGSRDGDGKNARFSMPMGMATDRTSVFVCDFMNGAVRKIDIKTGSVSTVAIKIGDGSPAMPAYIATDGKKLYMSCTGDKGILAVPVTGGEARILGGDYSGAGRPAGVATDGAFVYACNTDEVKIHRIDLSTGKMEMTGLDARAPLGIATDGSALFVTDVGDNLVMKVPLSAGSGTVIAGAGDKAGFGGIRGITAMDGVLYVCEADNQTVMAVDPVSGRTETVSGDVQHSGFADGGKETARFNWPVDVAAAGGSLFVCDYENHAIRRIVVKTGAVSTLAGKPEQAGRQDGAGTQALFFHPRGIATDGATLFVCDEENHAVRTVDIGTGRVATLAGKLGEHGSADGAGSSARFEFPGGIATDGTSLFVSDWGNNTVRKIDIRTGTVTTLAGKAGSPGFTDGAGSSARFDLPCGLAVDRGILYVADNGNHAIRAIDLATGAVSTPIGKAGAGYADGAAANARTFLPTGVCAAGGKLYFTQPECVRRIE